MRKIYVTASLGRDSYTLIILADEGISLRSANILDAIQGKSMGPGFTLEDCVMFATGGLPVELQWTITDSK